MVHRHQPLAPAMGIFYGDSDISVRRSVFEELGGYQSWPVLEDYDRPPALEDQTPGAAG